MKTNNADSSFINKLGIIYIEVTNKCNLACKYCYAIQRYQKANTMTIELFKQIINFVLSHSKQHHISIIFHGGEPLLASTVFFKECIAFANLRFQEVGKTVDYGIQSNLLLINNEIIEIIKSNNIIVSASIDGPSQLHDDARSGWDKTIANYKKLKELGVQVNFITVCSQHNKNHINDLFKMARDLDARSLQLNIASSSQRIDKKSPYKPLSASEIVSIFKDCIKYSKKYGIVEKKLKQMVENYLCPINDRLEQLRCDSPFCYAGVNMLVFTPNGKIHACSPAVPLSLVGEDYSLGDIKKEIKASDFINALKRFHGKSEKYYNQCIKCKAAKICDFGCPAFDRIDPITAQNHCLATKALFEILEKMSHEELELCITPKLYN